MGRPLIDNSASLLARENSFTKAQAFAGSIAFYFDDSAGGLTSFGWHLNQSDLKLNYYNKMTRAYVGTSLEFKAGKGLQISGAAGAFPNAGYVNARGYQVDAAAIPFQKKYESPAQAVNMGGAITLTHGLGGVPDMVQVLAKCISAEYGYAVGNLVPIQFMNPTTGSGAEHSGVSVVLTSTQIKVRMGNDANVIYALRHDTGDRVSFTNSRWQLIFKAYA